MPSPILSILDDLKRTIPTLLTTEIESALKRIQEICNTKYSDQHYHGNAALNRLMLLDSQIAELLTPDVLAYVFSNHNTAPVKIKRGASETNLHDAIYYGFADGLDVIRLMPNNSNAYGMKEHRIQRGKFAKNTQRIVDNLRKALGVTEIEPEPSMEVKTLARQFERIIATIKSLKIKNKASSLIRVPGFTQEQLRLQVEQGLKQILDKLSDAKARPRTETLEDALEKETLDGFCEKFLQSEDAILDAGVSHLFYDRAHIEVALEYEKSYEFSDGSFSLQAVFEEMVQKISRAPDAYPTCAVEQLCLRLRLVENDLIARFKDDYQNLVTSESAANIASTASSALEEHHTADVFKRKLESIQNLLLASLEELNDNLKTHSEVGSSARQKGEDLYKDLSEKQEALFKSLATDTRPEDVHKSLIDFRDFCHDKLTSANKIMGHGWLYRAVEVVLKAVIGLFAGIGMVLGTVIAQGLAKSSHRQQFSHTFFSLNRTPESRALDTFRRELGQSVAAGLEPNPVAI